MVFAAAVSRTYTAGTAGHKVIKAVGKAHCSEWSAPHIDDQACTLVKTLTVETKHMGACNIHFEHYLLLFLFLCMLFLSSTCWMFAPSTLCALVVLLQYVTSRYKHFFKPVLPCHFSNTGRVTTFLTTLQQHYRVTTLQASLKKSWGEGICPISKVLCVYDLLISCD